MLDKILGTILVKLLERYVKKYRSVIDYYGVDMGRIDDNHVIMIATDEMCTQMLCGREMILQQMPVNVDVMDDRYKPKNKYEIN